MSSSPPEHHAHGDGGVFFAGDWINVEQCHEKDFFCTKSKPSSQTRKCGGNCSTCAHKDSCSNDNGRSRSVNCAAKPDGTYDVCIIGAGCIGASVARELSRTNASVIVLEGSDDVTQGATKGNSGIVHSGYDDKPGTNRSKYCPKGCVMFPQLDRELHFGFTKNGSMVLSFSAEQDKILEKLMEQGATNGVKNLSIIHRDEILRREPEVHPDVRSALLAEDAGTIIPYEFCIALAENAVDNGVELRIRRVVTDIQLPTEKDGLFTVTADHWEASEEGFKPLPKDPRLAGVAGGSSSSSSPFLFEPKAVGAQMLLSIPVAAGVFYTTNNPMIAAVAFIAVFMTTVFFVPGAMKHEKAERAKSVSPSSAANNTTTSAAIVGKPIEYSPSKGTIQGGPVKKELIRARFVVNCAGCGSDKIAELAGDTDNFKVMPRHGDYVLLHKKEGKRVNATLFPCPDPVLGKGVLVQTTLWGNLILGPTARDEFKKDPANPKKLIVNEQTRNDKPSEIIHYIVSKCRELCPSFKAEEVIHTFSGARAKTTKGDWIIEPSPVHPRMIYAAGIDSPGLAGSPAIALDVVRLLADAGCSDVINERNPHGFNPIRAPIIVPKKGMKDAHGVPLKYTVDRTKVDPKAPMDPRSNVVCKCEKVTEAEIVEALRRSLPIDNTQAIRRRTRAGMGHCQGDPANYCCEDRVAEIIARETGLPIEQVGRRPWPASSVMPKRWFGETEKEWVARCGRGEETN
jgi:glycerol-3-phosphate dehydrogenase